MVDSMAEAPSEPVRMTSPVRLDDAMFDPPAGAFVVARLDDANPVGGVGLRAWSVATGEIKRLWVDQRYRGSGLGRTLMDAICEVARARGYDGLRLATGSKQPEAVALYTGSGWTRRSEDFDGRPVGECAFFFEKQLGTSGGVA